MPKLERLGLKRQAIASVPYSWRNQICKLYWWSGNSRLIIQLLSKHIRVVARVCTEVNNKVNETWHVQNKPLT